MFLCLVGEDNFEQFYPIKYFSHPQEQDNDSNRDSGHGEEKYSQHLSIFWIVSAVSAPSLALSRSTFVRLVVVIRRSTASILRIHGYVPQVSILIPQIDNDAIFIARAKLKGGEIEQCPPLQQIGLGESRVKRPQQGVVC
jgi:hypothetical protein